MHLLMMGMEACLNIMKIMVFIIINCFALFSKLAAFNLLSLFFVLVQMCEMTHVVIAQVNDAFVLCLTIILLCYINFSLDNILIVSVVGSSGLLFQTKGSYLWKCH